MKLETNMAALKSAASRLTALNFSARDTTCMMIFIVLFVFITFMMALIFMRFFRVQV